MMNRPGIINILTGSILALVLLTSCGGEGEHPLKEEYYYLEDTNKEWLAPDTVGGLFYMTDENGISQSFVMKGNTSDFGKSWSTVMGINTRTTYTEECFQHFNSSFGYGLRISMRAYSPPHGNSISICLRDVRFSYDFDFEVVHSLDTPFGYKNLLTTDKGYEVIGDGEILSSVDFLESLDTRYDSYTDVMRFTFNDFNDQWTDFTPSEFYIARGIGLVKYCLAGGICVERRGQ